MKPVLIHLYRATNISVLLYSVARNFVYKYYFHQFNRRVLQEH